MYMHGHHLKIAPFGDREIYCRSLARYRQVEGGVAPLLQLRRQRNVARAHDASRLHDVHHVGGDVIQLAVPIVLIFFWSRCDCFFAWKPSFIRAAWKKTQQWAREAGGECQAGAGEIK